MGYVLAIALGSVIGCLVMAVVLAPRQRRAEKAIEEAEEVRRAATAIAIERTTLADQRQLLSRDRGELEAEAKLRAVELAGRAAELEGREEELGSRVVTLHDLQRENALLKRDLQNIDVHLNKVKLDAELQRERQESLDARSAELAARYLAENVRLIGGAVNAHNYALCKDRLLDVVRRVREIGFVVVPQQEQSLVADLKAEFELAVRAAFEREEQARIKAQIREEEQLKREVERELKQLERERVAIQAALDRALAEAQGKHDDEVDRLQARLAEAEAKSQRAISMAQQTRAGFVYVISNVGSFGEGVYKIGMTRRLEPLDRVHELGDASVPFPFDVHMMIKCDDAPALENALHRAIHKSRMNKVNLRKEFFRADFQAILDVVRRSNNCEPTYVADAKALEYRQSLTMSEQDAEYIERVHDQVERPVSGTVDED